MAEDAPWTPEMVELDRVFAEATATLDQLDDAIMSLAERVVDLEQRLRDKGEAAQRKIESIREDYRRAESVLRGEVERAKASAHEHRTKMWAVYEEQLELRRQAAQMVAEAARDRDRLAEQIKAFEQERDAFNWRKTPSVQINDPGSISVTWAGGGRW